MKCFAPSPFSPRPRKTFPGILLALALLPVLAFGALDRPWQQLSNPSAAELEKDFAAPPPAYSAQFTWGWGGPVDRASIVRDLDGMKALGVHAAIIEPKAGMTHPYLSPEYFDLVRIAVAEARKRDLRLWIMDDGDYPSGLAGGKFTEERPELRMKALAAPERIPVAAGAAFSRTLGPRVICAVAIDRATRTLRVLPPDAAGRVGWTAPAGGGEVVLPCWEFRSGPTRSANNPTGAKDMTHSLMDYLDPAATQQFKVWTFEQYRDAIGDEFGKTVLGFRGDEPAFGFNPWTPDLLKEFQRRKGYDLRPYLALFPARPGAKDVTLTAPQRRAYADYCDVWSDLFRDNYFNMEAAWCADHGLEMQLHIEHEEILPQLALADGDYFKCFRNIQVPGIDIIWHQVWMDNPADFPKLASSAAHLYGHPRAMCEAFAAYRPPPNLEQARWLLNFLMAHGINRIEYMYWPSSVVRPAVRPTSPAHPSRPRPAGGGNRYYRDPGFPAVAAYVNRVSYLLGEGRPAADIGLFVPSSSFWLADAAQAREINRGLLDIAHQLLAHQRDFDFVDEQALSSVLAPQGSQLVNLSGQGYRAIIVPPSLALSHAALDRLHAFATDGGRVIFIGAPPALVTDRTFLDARGPADISWATFHETTVRVTPAVLDRLPEPDFMLAQADPLVSYNHRRIRDGDVYFIFNSGSKKTALLASLAPGTPTAPGAAPTAQLWDAGTGKIASLPAARPTAGRIEVPLTLEAGRTAIVVLTGAK
jgi:hypothetical protein